MSWTKRELIVQAFEEIGLASYVFDLTPDQLNSAMKRLNGMMAVWSSKGIKLGYPIPVTASGGDLDDDSNIPDYANEAVYLNLGIRIAPSFGKTVSPDVKSNAKLAYDNLLIKAAFPQEMQLPSTMPLGLGNKTHRIGSSEFSDEPDDNPLQVGGNGQLIFVGD